MWNGICFKAVLTTNIISLNSFGQIQFKDCDNGKPVSSLMIFDADNNYIGLTNEQGWLEQELSSRQLVINHPVYGNQKVTLSNEKQVCITLFNNEMKELVIEKGVHVRTELLKILENSYKDFSKTDFQSVYKIADHAFVNNVLNESLLGHLKFSGNGRNILYLDPKYEFTEYIHKKEYNYYVLPHYSPFALDKQIFPLHNRKDYKQFVTFINESEISKSGNNYYIDLPKIEDFITIETAEKNQKIARISFPKVQKDSRPNKFGSFIQYVNTEMFFDTESAYRMTSMELKTYYEIEDKKVRYSFKATEVDLS